MESKEYNVFRLDIVRDTIAVVPYLVIMQAPDMDQILGSPKLQGRFAEQIRTLSKVSDLRGIWAIARQWLVMAAACAGLYLLRGYPAWWWTVYPVAAIVIASRQHALLGLMHDGTHYRLIRNRSINDLLSDFFCAFPIGLSTELYRRQHLLHHQYTNKDGDPYWVQMQAHDDWRWPKDHLVALRLFASDLMGLCCHKTLLILFQWSPFQPTGEKNKPLPQADRIRFLIFITAVTAVLGVTGSWTYLFLLWFLPLVTIFGALIRLRSVAEHLVLPSEHELNSTRHVEATILERFLLAPVNLNYHLAHHLFPSVPFYNLPKLHQILLSDEMFREKAHITKTYFGGVLAEVTT
jgi:fatty acid desaturase